MMVDGLILACFLSEMYRGYRKGVIYTLGVLLAFFVAFYAASYFSPQLSEQAYQLAVDQGIVQGMEQNISKNLVTEKNGLASLALPEAYQRILDQHVGDSMLARLQQSIKQVGLESQAVMKKAVADVTSNLMKLIFQALVFLALFSLGLFLLRLILRSVSQLMNKIPVLGAANRGLGLAFGLVMGLFLSALSLQVLGLLTPLWPVIQSQLSASILSESIMASPLTVALMDIFF